MYGSFGVRYQTTPMKQLYTLLFLLSSLAMSAQTHVLSPLFGNNGSVQLDTWSGNEVAKAHVLQPDGKLLIAGTGYWSSPNSFRVSMARIDTACGVLDDGFSNDGLLNIHFEQRTICHDMTVQPDGKIIVCGVTAPSNGGSAHKPSLFRLQANGDVDSSFNQTGYHKSSFDPVSSGAFWKCFVLPDGRITCVGASTNNINGGVNAIGAQRFLADGTLDQSFDGDGKVVIPMSGTGHTAHTGIGTGLLQPDGKVIAIDLMSNGTDVVIGMARFNTDGSPDPSFGTNGLALSTVISDNGVGEAGIGAVRLGDGRIVVSSTAPIEGFLMARFLPNGALDTSYGANGVSTVVPASGSIGRDMHLLPDGATLQFGAMNWNNGPPCVVKRLADGSPDTTFGTNGVQTIATGTLPTFEKAWGGLALPSGRILAYGETGGGVGGQMLVTRITSDPAAEHFVDLGDDVDLCPGDSVVLDAGPGASWSWSDGSTDQTLVVDTAAFVQVTVVDQNGCTDSDLLEVALLPGPAVPVIVQNGVDLSTTASGDLQWYLNGAPLPGADQNMLTATVNGDYTVSVTDTSGCTAFSSITTVAGVGLWEADPGTTLRLFPNPATTHFQVQGTDPGQGQREVVLIDASGRSMSRSMDGNGRVEVGDLAPGVYAVRIVTSMEQQGAGLLVVQR